MPVGDAGPPAHLVRAPCDHHGAQAVPREGHVEGLDGHRLEVQDAGVQVDGGQRAWGVDKGSGGNGLGVWVRR